MLKTGTWTHENGFKNLPAKYFPVRPSWLTGRHHSHLWFSKHKAIQHINLANTYYQCSNFQFATWLTPWSKISVLESDLLLIRFYYRKGNSSTDTKNTNQNLCLKCVCMQRTIKSTAPPSWFTLAIPTIPFELAGNLHMLNNFLFCLLLV